MADSRYEDEEDANLRREIMAKYGPVYDKKTADMLGSVGYPRSERATRIKNIPAKEMPYTAAGIPNLLVREMPMLDDTGALGFVLNSNRVKDKTSNQAMQPNVFLASDAAPHTLAHEVEHLLARQNAGWTTETRDMFRRLLGSEATPGQRSFLNGLKTSLPYLKEKYGLEDGYMDKDFIDRNGGVGLHEIFATLSGIETHLGVDLTKDPELRKTMFKDRNVREAYNAVTGLRQTRLDAKDLKPYTRLEEPVEPGFTGKLKRLIGYANGGAVPRQPKLI